jgi:UDP-glucose 4-epimerase
VATGGVRSGRSGQAALQRVVVLGRGAMAAAVADHLEGVGAVPEVVRLDDLPRQEAGASLTGVDALVVLADEADFGAWLAVPAALRRRQMLDRVERGFEGARVGKVPYIVVISSAIVYGATPGRPLIDDDEPLPDPPEQGLGADLREVEAAVARLGRRRGLRYAILRPASVVGSGIDTMIVRHFEAPRLLAVRGTRRDWQFVHVEDVARAVEHILALRLDGVMTVASDGVLSHEEVVEVSGMRTVEVPPVTAFATARQLYRAGVLPAPSDDLAYAVYPWTVSSSTLRATGWVPRWTNMGCLKVLLEESRGRRGIGGRRVGGKDVAALGAAGAAVALIGTAAAVRRARLRRRG